MGGGVNNIGVILSSKRIKRKIQREWVGRWESQRGKEEGRS